jgi:uncharacterized repeat protein (TIGR03803 family)
MTTTELNILIAGALLFVTHSTQALQPEVLYAFRGSGGMHPHSSLVQGRDGNFYGTSEYVALDGLGGTSGLGIVFQVTPNGLVNTLCSFSRTNGAHPRAGLVLGHDGQFYGTTAHGGSSDHGTVFRVSTSGELTTLVSFNYYTNGIGPQAALTLGNDGHFYGTTSDWINWRHPDPGTVFRITTNGVLTTLTSTDPSPSGLVLGNDGNLYGTTQIGGTNGFGTVFRVTTNGMLTTLVMFNEGGSDGMFPVGLTLGSDGSLYGTTTSGGKKGFGTVFKVTTNGLLTSLFSFAGTNGAQPGTKLLLGKDGNFYGTTSQGGSSNHGTVFKVTANGFLTSLASFNIDTNGAHPSALVQGSDGNFYGSTPAGGPNGGGTIFRLVIPKFGSVTRQPEGSMFLTGTGPALGSYRLWVSTDLSLPLASWTHLATASFDSNGNFSHPDPNAATNTSRFYHLSVP